MNNVWQYGNAGDRFPITRGDVWLAGAEWEHMMYCADVLENTPAVRGFLNTAPPDLFYIDPPWNQSKISGFYTKAGFREKRPPFKTFLNTLIRLLSEYDADVWMEMGQENVDLLDALCTRYGGTRLRRIPITYAHAKPCFLTGMRFGRAVTENHLPSTAVRGLAQRCDGADDEETPYTVLQTYARHTTCARVADLCIGRGLSARAAQQVDFACSGVELHPRRLAHVLQFYAQCDYPIHNNGPLNSSRETHGSTDEDL